MLLTLFLLAVSGGFLIDAFDRACIRKCLAGRGFTIIAVKSEFIQIGWFGPGRFSAYSVRYRDRAGAVHGAHCEVGFFSGVRIFADAVLESEDAGDVDPAKRGGPAARRDKLVYGQ